MKITAITRYKHGELYAILKRLGWSQAELARRTGLRPELIGEIINLARRPSAKQADAIQSALGQAGEYLDVLSEWPEAFVGLQRGYKRVQTEDVEMDRLLDHPEVLQLAAPEVEETTEIDERLEALIGELPEKEQVVLRERIWNGNTLNGIGKKIGVSGCRVRHIADKALRRLQHPSRIQRLAANIYV